MIAFQMQYKQHTYGRCIILVLLSYGGNQWAMWFRMSETLMLMLSDEFNISMVAITAIFKPLIVSPL